MILYKPTFRQTHKTAYPLKKVIITFTKRKKKNYNCESIRFSLMCLTSSKFNDEK